MNKRAQKKILNPFSNLPIRTKIFVNMLIAQIGFAAITIVAILSHSKIAAIVAVNIVFGLIIVYTNWAAYVRIEGGIQRFKTYMNDLMDFSFMRTNRIEKARYMKNDEIGMLLTELNNYVDHFDAIRKADMKVLGEVILILDKMSQGIYQCRVHSKSENFMIQAVGEMINKTLDKNQKISLI